MPWLGLSLVPHLLHDGPGDPLSRSAELNAQYIVRGAMGHGSMNE
jgi:hypothetical protein